jgi:hypothetical protein
MPSRDPGFVETRRQLTFGRIITATVDGTEPYQENIEPRECICLAAIDLTFCSFCLA